VVSRRKAWLKMLRNPVTAGRGITDIIRFIRGLRGVRYDIAIDFQGLFKSHWKSMAMS
jgi:ADP-heptose:LPS heptosyltransferase